MKKNKIHEITKFIKDGTHASFENEKSDYFLLSAKNIKNSNVLIGKEERTISKESFDIITKNLNLIDGDILLTIVGTVGNLAIYKEKNKKICFQRSVAIFRFKENIDYKYMFYQMQGQQFQKELKMKTVISAQPGIYLNELNSIFMYVPSLDKQKQIGNFLSNVDKLIESKREEIKLKEEYKKGIIQKIFNKEIRFKDEDGNYYPEWEEKKIKDYFTYENGKAYENEMQDDGIYSIISLNSISLDGKIKPNLKKLNTKDIKLKKNDLVMILSDVANGYFLGVTAIIDKDDKYILNQRVGLLRAKKEINVGYFRECIMYNQKYFKLMGQGSSQQNISKADVENFLIKVPYRLEQKKIFNVINIISLDINYLKFSLNNLEILKKELLRKFF